MAEWIGPDTLMSAVTTETIAEVVERRKAEPRCNSKHRVLTRANSRGEVEPQRLSGSYINRYTWKLFRRVYIMARDVWKVPVQQIKWDSPTIAQNEADPRTREIKLEEELKIEAYSREGYGACFRFAVLAGMRLENFTTLSWSEVDLLNREINIKQKGSRPHSIKIGDEMLAILKAERGKHPDYVFSFLSQRTWINPTNGKSYVRGQRYPLTTYGFVSWFRRVCKKLNIDVTRHDIRRTTGGRLLRSTGNLKAVSQHLGHSDIAITAKHYAHVSPDEMLDQVKVVEGLSGWRILENCA